MMTIRIDPYKAASKGAKALSQRTGILRATTKQVQKHRTFDTVLNWGNSERRFHDARYINDPEAVTLASNKLRSARRFGEAYITQPPYTTDGRIAGEWHESGRGVCCRTLLRASGGRGLTYVRGRRRNDRCSNGRLVEAPLYTQYIKKADEYRIHVFDGNVIDVQQKRKRQEVPNEEVNYQIRNACNGWVFCRDDVDCPESLMGLAIRAVSVCGLDFGAVDIGYNRDKETGYVFEVNTAPGVEGTTLDKYFEAICGLLPSIRGSIYEKRRRK